MRVFEASQQAYDQLLNPPDLIGSLDANPKAKRCLYQLLREEDSRRNFEHPRVCCVSASI